MSEQKKKDRVRFQALRESIFYVVFWTLDFLTMGWMVFMTLKAMKEHPEWQKTYRLRTPKKTQ